MTQPESERRGPWPESFPVSCHVSGAGRGRLGWAWKTAGTQRSAWGAQNLPDSGVLSRLCPGNGYSCPPCVSSPHGSPGVAIRPPAALQVSRADYHTVCRWRVKIQRGQAACPRAQPSVMRGLLHCTSANVSLPDSKTHVPSFPRVKVSKIGLCLTNDAKKTFNHQARQQSDVIVPGSFCL